MPETKTICTDADGFIFFLDKTLYAPALFPVKLAITKFTRA